MEQGTGCHFNYVTWKESMDFHRGENYEFKELYNNRQVVQINRRMPIAYFLFNHNIKIANRPDQHRQSPFKSLVNQFTYINQPERANSRISSFDLAESFSSFHSSEGSNTSQDSIIIHTNEDNQLTSNEEEEYVNCSLSSPVSTDIKGFERV